MSTRIKDLKPGDRFTLKSPEHSHLGELAMFDDDGYAEIYDLQTGTRIHTLDDSEPVSRTGTVKQLLEGRKVGVGV